MENYEMQVRLLEQPDESMNKPYYGSGFCDAVKDVIPIAAEADAEIERLQESLEGCLDWMQPTNYAGEQKAIDKARQALKGGNYD